MNKRWKPKLGDKYWFVRCGMYIYVEGYIYEGDSMDTLYVNGINCFRTKKEAMVKLKQIKKVLKERE